MAPRLTVHLRNSATDTFVEVDGERIETQAVQFVGEAGKLCNVSLYLTDVELVDERSGVGQSE